MKLLYVEWVTSTNKPPDLKRLIRAGTLRIQKTEAAGGILLARYKRHSRPILKLENEYRHLICKADLLPSLSSTHFQSSFVRRKTEKRSLHHLQNGDGKPADFDERAAPNGPQLSEYGTENHICPLHQPSGSSYRIRFCQHETSRSESRLCSNRLSSTLPGSARVSRAEKFLAEKHCFFSDAQ
ncbi:hypothetical protein TNCV_3319001 [Trichonephila clavipes]|nr:hypothetical protein TNCV_3319001 [Trichonephila clavipes]